MPGQIVLFGATGYTGRLAAAALVRRGVRPVLAARSEGPLRELAAELGGLETRVADVSRPETVRALVAGGDVLLTTVGPFARFGGPAVRAAVEAGCAYVDSTGEPAFIRQVFQRWGPEAERTGAALVTAFGYDWVPGNLAGGMALEEAGDAAVRLDIGYFIVGDVDLGKAGSGGTRASTVGATLEPSHTFAEGAVRLERAAARVRAFDVRGRERSGISVGSSEALALPRLSASLRDVDVYLGWFGPYSRAMQAMSAGTAALIRVPGVKPALERVSARLVSGSNGGPDREVRARSRSHFVAVASDAAGRPLSTVHLEGPNHYDLTADLLAWGAERALEGHLSGSGALGPVDGFGLDALRAGCAEAGLTRV
ncbi:MAG TPA: saccharopine dehydrogenase NADP-binding domain-containing protein [Capillimicrobium sp.]|nr:saccharopine dehydrogenase NADP-binding domain-containing protein [Capillimicrobium sp.]